LRAWCPRERIPSARQKLDGAEPEATFEREIAEELARPLVQIVRIGPTHVLAARARARFLIPPPTGAERPRKAAAKALDCERLHGSVVGFGEARRVPKTRDAL